MPTSNAAAVTPLTDLDALHAELSPRSAQDIIRWAYQQFGERLILTSSFGAQAAVMLHLATSVAPDIPVVFIDTGYLFPETYQFAEALTQRLKLNLKVINPILTAARMEALHGKIWEDYDGPGHNQYAYYTKVEPMQRALKELNAAAWLAGLRGNQTEHRATLRIVEKQTATYKVHPILAWNGKQVHEYLKAHDLPYHPLVEKGFLSIGDTHSTTAVGQGGAPGDERTGRFHGLRQECGLHLPTTTEENASRAASGL
jgi:phosphoadenosine phosphosulfate reductase